MLVSNRAHVHEIRDGTLNGRRIESVRQRRDNGGLRAAGARDLLQHGLGLGVELEDGRARNQIQELPSGRSELVEFPPNQSSQNAPLFPTREAMPTRAASVSIPERRSAESCKLWRRCRKFGSLSVDVVEGE